MAQLQPLPQHGGAARAHHDLPHFLPQLQPLQPLRWLTRRSGRSAAYSMTRRGRRAARHM